MPDWPRGSKLKKLKLHRFRYIKPGTELEFTERFNVLLGKNGTGKTTLLDLLSMVLRSDFAPLRDEEFDLEYEYSHEHGAGLVRISNTLKPSADGSARGRLVPAARDRGTSIRHQPRVHVVLHRQRLERDREFEIEIDGASMRWRQGGGEWEGNTIVNVFDGPLLETLGAAIPRVDRPSLEAVAILWEFDTYGRWAYRFDEALDVFESMTTNAAERRYKAGRPPAIALDRRFGPGSAPGHGESAGRLQFFPFPYQPALPAPGQASTGVDIDHSVSLRKFPELTGMKHMSMSLAVRESWQEPDGLWWGFDRAEFLFSRAAGTQFNHNALSYGQKRLLAFLYYLDANGYFVIADELVNGMHHDWIRSCLEEIGERQAFLTSQNPLLLDYLPLESAEQAQKTFIQCLAEVTGDTTQLTWSNLAPDDARELFADYLVGIQHIGEILRVRGLW